MPAYRITHRTTYDYTDTVEFSHHELHLSPRPVSNQKLIDDRIETAPTASVLDPWWDSFGNRSTHLSIQQPHSELTVTGHVLVEIQPTPEPLPMATGPWEKVMTSLRTSQRSEDQDAYSYCFNSPMITCTPELRAFAEASFTPGRPVLDAAIELMGTIHEQFEYHAEATTIATPLSEVLANRQGVCQDFAHLQIGMLRSLGLAARYVSGYLRTIPPPGQPRLVGADASHAWLSVYCPEIGWVDLDPTNNAVPSSDHVTLAWGRDFSDVTPIRGVMYGGGDHAIDVSVDVEPLDDAAPVGAA